MSDADEAAAFAALADPTRRALLDAIGRAGTTTATALAADLPVSRQAVVKHLQVLAAAGMVEADKVGREQRYRIADAPFAAVDAWMRAAGAAWDRRLARLADQHRR